MSGQNSRRRPVPAVVYVGVVTGAVGGAFIGNALCLGYDFLYGPWFPQAGVNPQPAGWAGWWILGGVAVGSLAGLAASVVAAGLWRLARGPRPPIGPGGQ